ncbi:hypothetical protein PQC13_gp062 [Synechococcus phage S-SRM01]|uniref:Uncharacterized protein n=1 Tax=Synechococcus phage S-SRM01 TaxID=2781608 RepID=A0A879R2Z4_9CAUD|nr:hypothetical protein PQC13_gp062 [Synechococcus phage S-SRM01]QPX48027.1 hypothetical protein [Synechococcus phage S-SRM01]
MHNLISYNQLASWKHLEDTVNHFVEESELINDYYTCLIDCDESQQECKRICRKLLKSS